MDIDRTKAIQLLAKELLQLKNQTEKLQILKDNYWWFNNAEAICDAIEEGDYPVISDELIHIIHHTPMPSIEFPETNLLLEDYCSFELKKVHNTYLSHKLKILTGIQYNVIGNATKTSLCPCCFYYSLDFGEEGLWDICSVCFWENGGASPNHMSLDEAQKNFAKFGAINQQSLQSVDPEGKLKYIRKASSNSSDLDDLQV